MDIVDRLQREHADLRCAMDELQAGTPDPVEVRSFGQALLSHSKAEDDLLFRELEGLFPSPGPLDVMRDEHEAIEEQLASLCAHATEGPWQPAGIDRLLDAAREHFRKEEMVLFPMAKEKVQPERLEFLGDALAAMRAASARGFRDHPAS